VTEPRLTVEVTDKAKERLRAALAREAKARVVRIDVGRG
jgi:Fe-S cluster assembly iron-binding protein IscA